MFLRRPKSMFPHTPPFIFLCMIRSTEKSRSAFSLFTSHLCRHGWDYAHFLCTRPQIELEFPPVRGKLDISLGEVRKLDRGYSRASVNSPYLVQKLLLFCLRPRCQVLYKLLSHLARRSWFNAFSDFRFMPWYVLGIRGYPNIARKMIVGCLSWFGSRISSDIAWKL